MKGSAACAIVIRGLLKWVFCLSIAGWLLAHFAYHCGPAETGCGVVGLIAGVEMKRRG